MKVKIMTKDIIGYLFFFVVAATCITVGAKTIPAHLAAGIFAVVLGAVLLFVTATLILRKS